MNQVNPNQKDKLTKSLAIFGFVGVVILGVWLAVQLVSLMPQAFSSLASIADGVYSYRETQAELTVTTENSQVESGEAFAIEWNQIEDEGAYTFSYTCTDGVSVSLQDNTGSNTAVTCDEAVTLGGDATSLMVTIESERHRSSNVAYTIAFVPQGETDALVSSNNTITAVNPSIPESGADATEEEVDSTENEDKAEDESEPTESETETTEDTTPNTPTTEETIILETPVSDPYGYTDLSVRLLGVGHLTPEGNFIKRGDVDNDARAAFQFEVKNIGTKTSTEWEFEARLTSGSTYNSPTQLPLKPEERVVFTLGYDDVGNDGINLIGATVTDGNDINLLNNSFTWAVSVVE